MPEDLGEGLELAAVGMGLVFFTLVIFLLILLALRKLFPGEEVAEIIETDGASEEAGPIEEAQPVSVELAIATPQEPSAAAVAPTGVSMSGGKIAAMAVAMYLAMEQEERTANTPAATTGGNPSQEPSAWSNLGRPSLWESQGRRPQAYGEKSHSAYSPRDGSRE